MKPSMFDSETNKLLNKFVNNYLELDYLNEKNKSEHFNWNVFFDRYYENVISENTNNVSLIKDETRKNNARHLEYIFNVDKLSFLSIVDAIQCKYEIDSLKQDIVKHQMQKIQTNLLETLKKEYTLNSHKFVLKYQFKDDTGNTLTSNKAGNLAFAVLNNASKVFMSSLEKIGFDEIFSIEIHISKKEIKRLELYKNFLKRNKAFNEAFKNEYIDSVSDSAYVTYYRWK